ncbi:MAG TPA: hypothetical protein PLC25_03265 [Bacilli bacterium]|nr:hypothetical protein [Bacilli bacterium]
MKKFDNKAEVLAIVGMATTSIISTATCGLILTSHCKDNKVEVKSSIESSVSTNDISDALDKNRYKAYLYEYLGYKFYAVSDKHNINDFARTDDYIVVNDEQKKLLDFMVSNKLLSVRLNKNKLVDEEFDNLQSTILYDAIDKKTGEHCNLFISYADPNKYSYTGDVYVSQTLYIADNIITNSDGKYEVVESPELGSIAHNKEYKYFSTDYEETHLVHADMDVSGNEIAPGVHKVRQRVIGIN